MTLDDLELLPVQGRILSEFRGISQISEQTADKRMKLTRTVSDRIVAY